MIFRKGLFYCSILLLFCILLSSIPSVGMWMGLHTFTPFLTITLLALLLVDASMIDWMQKYHKIWGAKIVYILLGVWVICSVVLLRFQYTVLVLHLTTYIAYFAGIWALIYASSDYQQTSLSPTLWGIVSAGSSLVGIFLSLSYASLVLSQGSLQDITCEHLQEYSIKAEKTVLQPFLHLQQRYFPTQNHISMPPVTESRWTKFKQARIDDVLAEKKVMTHNACDILFSQIATKISTYHDTIRVSLFFLLFFFFWPFVIFFLWIEAGIAFALLSLLAQCGIYTKKKIPMIAQHRE